MTLMPLPPEWLVRISRSKGKVYYYHPPTNKTQWSRPMVEQVIATGTQKEIAAEEETLERMNKRPKTSTLVASMRVGGSSRDPWDQESWWCLLRGRISWLEMLFLAGHSTGTGKTVTIAALTHQLLYVKDARSVQFHTVVVMLDRVKLNEQVGDVVENYLRRNGVDEVFRAESIEHLAKLLDVTAHTHAAESTEIDPYNDYTRWGC
ncbi:unnamed protein product [Peronospora destructor]|uniref:WW domain-containing protein n=1 Tax=Peronospora destructor TaxID=86335 RepID=A0AAV0VAU9_9STRA|nr:unnamed protein product [Peronospora destructor]